MIAKRLIPMLPYDEPWRVYAISAVHAGRLEFTVSRSLPEFTVSDSCAEFSVPNSQPEFTVNCP